MRTAALYACNGCRRTCPECGIYLSINPSIHPSGNLYVSAPSPYLPPAPGFLPFYRIYMPSLPPPAPRPPTVLPPAIPQKCKDDRASRTRLLHWRGGGGDGSGVKGGRGCVAGRWGWGWGGRRREGGGLIVEGGCQQLRTDHNAAAPGGTRLWTYRRRPLPACMSGLYMRQAAAQ